MSKILRIVLLAIIACSLIPATLLVLKRIKVEGSSRTVSILMDEGALEKQANTLNTTTLAIAERYRQLGLNGIALYEDTIESLDRRGEIIALSGSEVKQIALLEGLQLEIPTNSTLVTEIEDGALTFALNKYQALPEQVNFNGQDWYFLQGGVANDPAGLATEVYNAWQQAGWDIAYRPRNMPNMANVGKDFPKGANYLIHAGVDVTGNPNALADTVTVSQNYFTALIEGTPQAGMEELLGKVPTIRLFSINQRWLNTLEPEVAVDKFLLAANERGTRLLYLRPYTEEYLGDMFTNTGKLVSGLVKALEQDGFVIGEVKPFEFHTEPTLRYLSTIGIIAGLLLLIMIYPLNWGIFISVCVLGLGIFAGGGLNWDALALAAALSFPVLGYSLLPQRFYSYIFATLISLAGAMLLIAVGSDQNAMLAAEPFAGVAATLIVPPLLFLLHYSLRYRSLASYIVSFWNYRIRLGDVFLVGIGLIAFVLIFFRRGNFPIIGVSGVEITLRNLLSEHFVRPRFKELIGHTLGLLGIFNKDWAVWIQGVLLTAGVVAQATILNSFSHYHTPVLISLQRTIIAVIIGTILGLILWPLSRLGVYLVKRWLIKATE